MKSRKKQKKLSPIVGELKRHAVPQSTTHCKVLRSTTNNETRVTVGVLEHHVDAKYAVKKGTGELIRSPTLANLVKAYHSTGNFTFAVEAFVLCHDRGYVIPEFVASIIARHFRRFSEAKTKAEGLAALGFDRNTKGGAWQVRAAHAKLKQAEIVSLVDELLIIQGSLSRGSFPVLEKKEIFAAVADARGTTPGRVKELYYRRRREK